MTTRAETSASPRPHTEVLAASDLRKTYRDVVALDGVSFGVDAGEVFGVLGPNGAGKTTLIEIAVGLRAPTSGEVRVLGLDPRRHRELRHRVAVQPQHAELFPALTVVETLRLWASLYSEPRPIDEVLHLIDLEDKASARVKTLSGGQQQRLVLGLGVIARPEVLFLDEPSAGLDPAARQRLWSIIRAQAGSGAVVLSTHDMDEARSLCGRVAILDRGRLADVGSPDELVLRHFPQRRVSLVVDRQPDAAALAALPAVGDADATPVDDGWLIVVSSSDPDALLPPLLGLCSGDRPRNIAVTGAGLADVFLALTGARIGAAGERAGGDDRG